MLVYRVYKPSCTICLTASFATVYFIALWILAISCLLCLPTGLDHCCFLVQERVYELGLCTSAPLQFLYNLLMIHVCKTDCNVQSPSL